MVVFLRYLHSNITAIDRLKDGKAVVVLLWCQHAHHALETVTLTCATPIKFYFTFLVFTGKYNLLGRDHVEEYGDFVELLGRCLRKEF